MTRDALASEDLLSALDGVTIALGVFDRDGRLRFANAAAERLMGRTFEELEGVRHAELPIASASFDLAFREVLSDRQPRRADVEDREGRRLEVELTHGGGSVLVLWREASESDASAAPPAPSERRDEGARVRRQLEALLMRHEQSEQRTARLYVASAELARAATPHAVGSMLLAAARDAGATGGAVFRSGSVLELLASTDPALEARARRASEAVLNEEADFAAHPHELVLPLVLDQAPIGAVFLRFASPAHDEQRFFLRALCAQAAQAIDRAGLLVRERHLRAEAEAVNRAKDDFVAALSHELRTPLSAVLGWAHLLRAGTLGESEHTRALEAIERNARAQAQLVDDLLDVSRIATGKLHIERSRVNPADAIRSTLDALRPALAAKPLRLETALEDVGELHADPQRLQQIVWNLLNNAVKFTPRGGRVCVALRRTDDSVEIEVADEGKGIEPAFVPHLFRRFSQAESAISRQHGGLGLGLAITRHLVELHGGSIHAFSEGHGKGARFLVTLPRESAPRAGEEADLERARTQPPRLDGVRVLVVEDEPDTRELLATVLQRLGAEVAIAGSVGEALSAFEDARPDVLLSDIGMPENTGYDLIRAIRTRDEEAGGAVPAAALTAYAGAEDRRRALDAGFQLHLAKPVDPERLAEVVASLAASGLA